MKHLRKGNIAFWRNDQPGQRFHSGPIEKVSGKSHPGPGHAMIEGYGDACWFKPTFCLPTKHGERVRSAMADAESKHARKVSAATAEYELAIGLLLPAGTKL